jgi:hypothetical protein
MVELGFKLIFLDARGMLTNLFWFVWDQKVLVIKVPSAGESPIIKRWMQWD